MVSDTMLFGGQTWQKLQEMHGKDGEPNVKQLAENIRVLRYL